MSRTHLRKAYKVLGEDGQSFKDYVKGEVQRCREALDEALGAASKCHQGNPQFYTILRHVSASGMSRAISVHYIDTHELELRQLDYVACVLLGLRPDLTNGGVIIDGCGMDMGFALIDGLTRYSAHQTQSISHRWI